MVNYYHVLGLTETASPGEIKSAFKRLAVQYHPDKHPGRVEMEEKFKEINQAHQILSDPYEKARFDLKLKYQQFSSSEEFRPHGYSGSSWGSKRRPQPGYYTSKVDYRKNAIATAYAFGITFLMAIIVMTGFWLKESYDNHKREVKMAERRATFEKAKDQFETGEYKVAFELMSTMKYFDREEKDMKIFKDTMIDAIIERGNEEYEKSNFQAAIALYELIQQFQPENPFYQVKKKLADAYMYTGNGDKAVNILNSFVLHEYEVIESLVQIAEIYRDQFLDLDRALEHYTIAHRVAIKKYKQYFGEGYPLVISERYVPESHYYLYTGLADIYLQLNDTEMAIKASDWNKYVWPDSVQAYITSADAYIIENQISEACDEYVGAIERGWQGEPSIVCN